MYEKQLMRLVEDIDSGNAGLGAVCSAYELCEHELCRLSYATFVQYEKDRIKFSKPKLRVECLTDEVFQERRVTFRRATEKYMALKTGDVVQLHSRKDTALAVVTYVAPFNIAGVLDYDSFPSDAPYKNGVEVVRQLTVAYPDAKLSETFLMFDLTIVG